MGSGASSVERVLEYIRENWSATIHNSGHDDYPRVYLPRRYTAPAVTGGSRELRYWSTWFTNKGLLLDGELDLALANMENLFYMVDRFGFVPSGNSIHELNHSQPPCLAMMVHDIYRHTHDKEWLRAALDPLQKEYHFWMSRRVSSIDLNRYFHSASGQELAQFDLREMTGRLRVESTDSADRLVAASHFMAETESGHDFTPRFQGRCADFVPVDLNCSLYTYERTLAWICRELRSPEDLGWERTAENRLTLMRRYLWDGSRGVFSDYDSVNDAFSPVLSAVSVAPLAHGIATSTEARATIRSLRPLWLDHGISACEELGPPVHQWGYPNVWAPLQYICAAGFRNHDEALAREIARRFVTTVTTEFERSKVLWDKYDGITGEPGAVERRAQPVIGWTAGVFRVFVQEYELA
jgi:alpha,alpha-trehalase